MIIDYINKLVEKIKGIATEEQGSEEKTVEIVIVNGEEV